MNIAQHIKQAREHMPQQQALYFEGESWSYSELDDCVNRCAHGLHALGVGVGDRVALFLPNIPEFIIAYLGILSLGAVAVSVNAFLKQAEVDFLLQDSAACAVVTTAELVEQIPAHYLTTIHTIVVHAAAPDVLDFKRVLEQAETTPYLQMMAPSDPAVIVYSSGTTGFPKGVVLSHQNVVFTMQAKQRYCGMQATDRMLLFVPLFHCFGQNAILNSAFYVGATVILQRAFNLQTVLNTIEAQKVTMFFGVPTTFIALLSRATPEAMGSVRYYFSAAATLPVEIARGWYNKFNQHINEGYGLTETAPFAAYNHETLYKFGSIGTPIEQVEMKIVDPATSLDQPIDQLGEIVIRGPNVMLGYWNKPEATAEVFYADWFRSGDIGKIDADGYFYIVDRLKDMINVGGLKVYPSEVEQVLYEHPAVQEVAVYGCPDAFTGEQVRAAVVVKSEHTVRATEIIAFCRKHIAAYKIPVTVIFMDSLPKNATGKILRRVLSQM